MAEEAAAPVAPEGVEVKKPARGRPKDDQAPPKPKNGFQKVTGVARARIKEEKPELAMDLKGMAMALKQAWEDTPQAVKDSMQIEYEKEMEIWKPLWAAYKETDGYKAFFEVKQDYMDIKTKKKMIKSYVRGKIVVGSVVRVGAKFVHAYPEGEESKNYSLNMGQKGTIVAVDIGEAKNCEIQWEDGKKEYLKKYFGKLEDPDVPKRPKSGYMLFAGDVREAASKEVMDAGGGMGDIGKKISEWWEQTSEVKKAEFGERASRMKEVFDKEFRVYKMSDKFKTFENKKVNLESTQKIKKITRTTFNDAPKRAPSSFNLWKRGEMPKLMAANKANDITMTMGELGKKLGEMWQAVSEADKARFVKEAVTLKENWEKSHLGFKKQSKYMKFLEERQKVKIRQNRMVNLRDLPKKPKSVFALYAAEHKAEVPQGKGEGKGTSALKKKFEEAAEEEKAALAKKAAEAEAQFKKELEDFKAGDQFKTFQTTEGKVKQEFMSEAMKVMTIKFLDAAPPAPPKSNFAVYVGEKRKASGDADGAPKSKDAKRDEVLKFKADWDKLDKGVKDEYEVTKKERTVSWKEECRTFMQQELWQEYLKEAKRLKLPIKTLLQDKKAAIKTLKNGMRFVPLPEKPETIPQRPPNAFKIFVKEKKKEIDDPEKISNAWKEMDEEGKKAFEEKAKELQEQYVQDLKDFKASDEGKVYLRTHSGVLRTRKMVFAKFTYLKDMPKKPEGALKMYVERSFKAEKAANPEAKGFEVRKKLQDRWLSMESDEKEAIENEAKEKFDKYLEDLKAFKDGENYQKFVKATKTRKPKGKKRVVKKVGGMRGPPVPKEMPKKPQTAVQAFGKEEGNAGKDANAVQAAYDALPEEKREELEAAAKEAQSQYEAALFEFNKSDAGNAYQKALANFENKKKKMDLQARLAKVAPAPPKKPEGMPEKPPNAFRAFCKTKQGGGLDLAGLHKAWSEVNKETKDELEAKAREEEQKYQTDMAEFNKTEAGKKYNKQLAVNDKRKRLGEAKVKFLTDQPTPPARALKLFCDAKRTQVMRDNPDLKGIGAIQAKLGTMYNTLSAEQKEPYQNKEKELTEEYDRKMKEFHSSAEYKKFKAIENKVSSAGKGKAKAKASGPVPPPAPADLPKKPPMAFFMFRMENSGSPKDVHQKWLNLGAAGQEEWNKKHKEKMAEYEKAMKVFSSTADGKKYNRLRKGFDRKLAETKAKERFLGGGDAPKEPKKPMSAYFLFVNAKRESVTKELGTGELAKVSARVTAMWNDPAYKEEREAVEKKAAEAKEEYEGQMKEYKSSAAVKKFDRAMTNLKKPKGKVKVKAKKPVKVAKGKAPAKGKGPQPKAKGKAAAKSNKSSDSDVMGSDSSNSSSDSDSD